ncbi:mCG146053, partial [Mus musculus]
QMHKDYSLSHWGNANENHNEIDSYRTLDRTTCFMKTNDNKCWYALHQLKTSAPKRLSQVKQTFFILTFHCEVHGLADVCAHIVADLAEVVATVFFYNMLDQE